MERAGIIGGQAGREVLEDACVRARCAITPHSLDSHGNDRLNGEVDERMWFRRNSIALRAGRLRLGYNNSLGETLLMLVAAADGRDSAEELSDLFPFR